MKPRRQALGPEVFRRELQEEPMEWNQTQDHRENHDIGDDCIHSRTASRSWRTFSRMRRQEMRDTMETKIPKNQLRPLITMYLKVGPSGM